MSVQLRDERTTILVWFWGRGSNFILYRWKLYQLVKY